MARKRFVNKTTKLVLCFTIEKLQQQQNVRHTTRLINLMREQKRLHSQALLLAKFHDASKFLCPSCVETHIVSRALSAHTHNSCSPLIWLQRSQTRRERLLYCTTSTIALNLLTCVLSPQEERRAYIYNRTQHSSRCLLRCACS